MLSHVEEVGSQNILFSGRQDSGRTRIAAMGYVALNSIVKGLSWNRVLFCCSSYRLSLFLDGSHGSLHICRVPLTSLDVLLAIIGHSALIRAGKGTNNRG